MLNEARAGRFDIVCAEALDRISRDQEDMALVCPHLCDPLGMLLHARPFGIVQPQSTALGLSVWHFQPLTSPDTLDSFDIHDPASLVQHRSYTAIAIAVILERERRDVGGQLRFIIRGLGELALCGTMLTENPACPTLGHLQLIDDMIHTGAATGGAQKFPFAASARIILSKVRSETARRSRAFSASNSFRRFTCSPFRPPYSERHR